MIRKLLLIRDHQIIHNTNFLRISEKSIYVVVATEERKIFDFLFVHPVIDNQLQPDTI